MKFVKQISEDEFIVKMEANDADPTRRIILAHDYLQFNGRDWYCTDMHNLKGTWACGNVIHVNSKVQIPIRMAQDMLENVLTPNRAFLKKEHLTYKDGSDAYRDIEGMSYRYTKDDGTKMVAIYLKSTNKYMHLLLDVYDAIKENIKLNEQCVL